MPTTVREPGNLSCENVTRTASNRLMASPLDILYSWELAFILFRAHSIGKIFVRPFDSLAFFSLLYSFVFILQTTNGIIEGVDTFFLTVSVSSNWLRRLSLCFSLSYLSDLSFVTSPDIDIKFLFGGSVWALIPLWTGGSSCIVLWSNGFY
jgi:hypothetical protein